MAGDTDFLNHLVTLVGTLDDAALEALANKGLLRRARKDLEGGLVVKIGPVAGGKLPVAVGTFQVTFPSSGPSQAGCSCPAAGCCQHILAACLKVAELAPVPIGAGEAETVQRTGQSDFPDIETVKKWAGAENFRRALRLIRSGDVERIDGRTVRFAGGIEARLLPGSLDTGITNAPPRQKIAYIAAAVLGLLQQQGAVLPCDEQSSGSLDLGPLEDLQVLIEEGIDVGLNHLSRSFQMRMSRLSVHCRVSGLVRPSLEAESCAQEIEWLLARHALADQDRLFDKVTRLYALAESIRQQGPSAADAYVGTARSKYALAGTLGLVGVGCYPWETDSGFVGLTALFWSEVDKQYFSWSDSRPKHSTGGFSAHKRYEDAGPWRGGGLLRTLVRSRFKLENAHSNAQRRVSASATTSVLDSNLARAAECPPVITRWTSLHQRERPRGLLRGSPLDDIVHIRPARWGSPHFDEVEQRLLIPLVDEDEQTLTLDLPYSQLTAAAIFYLETWKADTARDSLIGYHRLSPSEHLFPVRLLRAGPELESIDLLFLPLPTKKTVFRGKSFDLLRAYVPLPQADDDVQTESNLADPLTQLLSPIDDLLVPAAQTGFSGGLHDSRNVFASIRKAGLSGFADLLQTTATPRDLLVARYVYLLLMEDEERRSR